MTMEQFKTWIEIISSLFTALGVVTAAIVALYKWGPGAGPRLLIRQLIFIPPGTQKDLKSKDIVVAADVIFANPGSAPEYITDISLSIINPKGVSCRYSPFIFAAPDAFFDKSKTPKWVRSLLHPLMIQGSDKDQQMTETSRNIMFFAEQDNHFSAIQGTYKLEFGIRRYSLLPWRRHSKEKMIFAMDDVMVTDLTSTTNPQKVALLDWHFKS